MSNSVLPYGQQPSRLLHPQESLGKNTGVACHFLLLQTPYTEINSKWIKDLNVRQETIKFLEENRQNTQWHKSKQDPLCPPPSVTEMKTKVNKWDLIKHKSFCTAKKTISKVERQPSEWEKIIGKETTDKWIISKLYNQLIELNARKTTSRSKTGEKT